jgi:hypothetical protein
MWVFLSGSFLSIVEHNADPSLLLVRARIRYDIEQVFPGTQVVETPDADYRFRVVVLRSAVARVISEEVLRINYGNFKDSVREQARRDVYSGVWSVMLGEQLRREEKEENG